MDFWSFMMGEMMLGIPGSGVFSNPTHFAVGFACNDPVSTIASSGFAFDLRNDTPSATIDAGGIRVEISGDAPDASYSTLTPN